MREELDLEDFKKLDQKMRVNILWAINQSLFYNSKMNKRNSRNKKGQKGQGQKEDEDDDQKQDQKKLSKAEQKALDQRLRKEREEMLKRKPLKDKKVFPILRKLLNDEQKIIKKYLNTKTSKGKFKNDSFRDW